MTLYILNDNINSFEHVIQCIRMYLNYPYTQCVSIAHIIHNTGKCLVKECDNDVLISEIYESLVKEGLTLKIEN